MPQLAVTTPGELRTAFVAAIKGITPGHPEHGQAWRYVPLPNQVPGPKIRNFHIQCGRAVPVDGGIFCSGCEYRFEMEILTSYGSLAPKDDDSIVSHDAQQLYRTLANLYATLSGLTKVEPLGWSDGPASEEGHVWGSHMFAIHYFADV